MNQTKCLRYINKNGFPFETPLLLSGYGCQGALALNSMCAYTNICLGV